MRTRAQSDNITFAACENIMRRRKVTDELEARDIPKLLFVLASNALVQAEECFPAPLLGAAPLHRQRVVEAGV